jgi:hypothetical protein
MIIQKDSTSVNNLSYEQLQDRVAIKDHLQTYLGLPADQIERIALFKAADLPAQYQSQLQALHDARLEAVTIGLVPDDLWFKGDQPSESHVSQKLIIFKQGYFEKPENVDEIAWLSHELAHCQKFLDSESPEQYQADSVRPAFDDLGSEETYPNNAVEQFAFTKQFDYLKSIGKSKEDVLKMLMVDYEAKDLPFFTKLLVEVYDE